MPCLFSTIMKYDTVKPTGAKLNYCSSPLLLSNNAITIYITCILLCLKHIMCSITCFCNQLVDYMSLAHCGHAQ